MKITPLAQILLHRSFLSLGLCAGGLLALVWFALGFAERFLQERWERAALHQLAQSSLAVESALRTLERDAQGLAEKLLQELRHPMPFTASSRPEEEVRELENLLKKLRSQSLPCPRSARDISLALFDPAGKLLATTGEGAPPAQLAADLRSGEVRMEPLTPGDLARGPTLRSFWRRADGSLLAMDLVFPREILETAFRQVSGLRTLPFVDSAGIYAVDDGRPLSPFFVPIPPREVFAARTHFRKSGNGGQRFRQTQDASVTFFLPWPSPPSTAFGNFRQMLRLALNFSPLTSWKILFFSAASAALLLVSFLLIWSQKHLVLRTLTPLKELAAHMARLAREKESYRGEKPIQTSVREFVELYVHFLHMAAAVSESLARQREVDAVRTSLLANVSHEFRTPMTAIKGFAQIMGDRLEQAMLASPENPLPPELLRELQELRSDLEILQGETSRLEDLVEHVLDLALLQGEEEHWTMELLDPRMPMEHAMEVYRPLMESSTVALHLEVEPDLPPVLGDLRRLTQVVEHLLSNALKFTSQGSVFCSVRHEGGFVVTRVEDTGPGVDPAQRNAIFEAFAQSGDVLTAKPDGAGLGLPLCKSIVQRHGGWIHMTSRRGSGSVFFFGLPAQSRPDPHDTGSPAPASSEEFRDA